MRISIKLHEGTPLRSVTLRVRSAGESKSATTYKDGADLCREIVSGLWFFGVAHLINRLSLDCVR